MFASADTDLIVDLSGVYSPQDGASFVPMNPGRLLDTRRGQALEANVEHVLDLSMLPASATDVDLNVTVTGSTAAGYVVVYPCGRTIPPVSNVNFTAGGAVANHVTTALGADRTVCVMASQKVDLVVDVTGVYRAAA